MMRITSVPVLAASALLLLAVPTHADVFSSQGFSGETTTLHNLPGVNLDAAGSAFAFGGVGGNCSETSAPALSMRNGGGAVMTECQFGNFSISTVRGHNTTPGFDTTYGGNPPPWEQGWKP